MTITVVTKNNQFIDLTGEEIANEMKDFILESASDISVIEDLEIVEIFFQINQDLTHNVIAVVLCDKTGDKALVGITKKLIYENMNNYFKTKLSDKDDEVIDIRFFIDREVRLSI